MYYSTWNETSVIVLSLCFLWISSEALQNKIKEDTSPSHINNVKKFQDEFSDNESINPQINNVSNLDHNESLPTSSGKKQQLDVIGKKVQHVKADNIQFRENKNQVERSPEFFTQVQKMKNDAIHYPIDNFNPKNILQTNLSPEEIATLPSVTPHYHAPIDLDDKKVETNGEIYGHTIKSMQLTLDIVRHSFWDEENVVFSPLSVYNVLAVLLLGAEGRTYDELLNVLHLGRENKTENHGDRQDVKFHSDFKILLRQLGEESGGTTALDIANQLFVDKSYNLNPSYVKMAKEMYDTPVEQFNFGKDGKLFKEKVNSWVDRKTLGKIKTIIDDPPQPDTTLALINAVYFKGAWETPFIEKMTRKSSFFVSENESLSVPMMVNELTVPYYGDAYHQMISIPYKDNVTSFFIILPAGEGIEGLKNLEQAISRAVNISADAILEKLGNMTEQNIICKLPKMKISTDGHMKSILSNMGIPSMFDKYNANFSRMSSNDGMYLSAVHHKAVMEVNEHGTEAAAVTFGTAERIFDPPIQFVANKPFMFFIYHKKANTILFWGRVVRPEW